MFSSQSFYSVRPPEKMEKMSPHSRKWNVPPMGGEDRPQKEPAVEQHFQQAHQQCT